MEAVTAWFARQADRERRAVLLEDALLAGRFLPYIFFRLRFWLARYGLASAVQVVQVLILHRLFPREGFLVLVGLLAAAALVTAAWWGALEILRARVRDLYRSGAPHQIAPEIGRWLSGALGVAVVCAASALIFLGWRAASAPGGLGPVDAAAAAILLRVAVDLPRRCYHSGLYALRRVYRPLPSMLALEVVSVGALLVLVPWLGTWAAPAAELIAVGIVTSTSVRYVARGYRLAGLSPHRHLRLPSVQRSRQQGSHRRRRPLGLAVRGAILPGVSAAMMSLDAIVVLGVFAAVDARGAGWPFALLVAACAPSVRAGFDWSQLLYFDLKRLESRPFANLRDRFVGRATKLSPLLGLFFWAVCAVVGSIVLGPGAFGPVLILLPFFVGASLLALGQMDAFSSGAYGPVVASGATFAASLLALGPLSAMGVGPEVWLDIGVFLALGTLVLTRRLSAVSSATGSDLLPADWLGRLGREGGPIRVGVFQAILPGRKGTAEDQRADAWRTRRLARRITERVRGSGFVARFGDNRIVWYERESGERPLRVDGEWIVRASGGRLRELRRSRAPRGQAALAIVAGWRLPGPVGSEMPETAPPDGGGLAARSAEDAIVKSFRQLFPTGIAFSPDRALPVALRGLTARQRRLVLSEALRHARGLSPSTASLGFDVTAYCPAGALELIFLVERSPSARGGRARWRAALRQAHFAAAVAASAAPGP